MTFLYSYKTSDGVRHENRIRAKSREQVFKLLRQEGIRPIKVTQKGADVVRIAKLLVCGAFIGVLAFKLLMPGGSALPSAAASANCPKELVERVEEILLRYRETIANYDAEDGRFSSRGEISPVLQRVRQAGEVTDYYRTFLQGIFSAAVSGMEVPDGVSASIRRYYGEVMSELDVVDERFRGREYVLTLLQDNWGAWRYGDRKDVPVVFDDAELQRDYDLHSAEFDTSTLRWQKDFAD